MAMFFFLQIALAGLALLWLAFAKPHSKRAALIVIAASCAMLLGLAIAGLWLYPPRWALFALPVLWGIASSRAWRRVDHTLKAKPLSFNASAAAFSVLGALFIWQGIAGRIAPAGEKLDLAAPLIGEGFCVVSGGAAPLMNFHMWGEATGIAELRVQSHGVDFVQVSNTGLRTVESRWAHPQPSSPRDYRVFGAPIHTPCAGQVIEAVDQHADQRVGVVDITARAGNFVVLQCASYQVRLAHMREGSVRVRAGQNVSIGDVLGEVGNTGYTSEPHLHLDVQRHNPGEAGVPIHVTFNGRFLSRHDCLEAR